MEGDIRRWLSDHDAKQIAKNQEILKQHRIDHLQLAITIMRQNDNGRDKAIDIHTANRSLQAMGVKQGYFATTYDGPGRKMKLRFAYTVWMPYIMAELNMDGI